jgi:hypothetical protein
MASTFFISLIALHTFILVALDIKFRRVVLYSSIGFNWTVSLLLCIIGPAAVYSKERGPFCIGLSVALIARLTIQQMARPVLGASSLVGTTSGDCGCTSKEPWNLPF